VAFRFLRAQLESLPPVMDELMLATALGIDASMIRSWVTHGLPFTIETSRTTGKPIHVFDREILIDWFFVMNKLYVSEWPEREAPFFIHNPRGRKMQLEKVVARAEEMLKGLPMVMKPQQCARYLGIGSSTFRYWRDVHKLPVKLISEDPKRYMIDKRLLINWLVKGRANPVLKKERQANVKKRRDNQATAAGG
jgi:hypothetical protein